jgi:lactoylglutathione lyase
MLYSVKRHFGGYKKQRSDFMVKVELGHVGLNVTNLEGSKAFYLALFDWKVLITSEDGEQKFAVLGNEKGAVLTLWEQSEGTFSSVTPGLHHLALQVSAPEDVQQMKKKLEELDIPIVYGGIVLHAEGRDSGGIYFNDPDGIRIEVFSAAGMNGLQEVHTHGPSCGFF